MARRITTRLFTILVLLLLVGCDHASKGIAKATLEVGGARELLGGLVDLRYVENTDIAFNLLRWVPEPVRFPLLIVSGAVAVLAMCLLLFQAREKSGMPMLALILLTAGAIGNYLDRLLRGYVVDFIDVGRWPVFNVADAYLTLGFVLVVWGYSTSFRRPATPSS